MYESGRRAGAARICSLHPPAAFLRNYILRRGILDGTVGLHNLARCNAYSVFLKFAKLWELQSNSQRPTTNSQPPPSPKSASVEADVLAAHRHSADLARRADQVMYTVMGLRALRRARGAGGASRR